MSAVAAPSDRRFRRAHVKPARKRRGWRAVAAPAARITALMLAVGFGFYRLAGLAERHRFAAILPGHGARHIGDPDDLHQRLVRLVERMRG